MITETYKLMCINNPDLQGLWKPKFGDRYISENSLGHIAFIMSLAVTKDEIDSYHKDYAWLPYQEDLQNLCDFNTLKVTFYKTFNTSNDQYVIDIVGGDGLQIERRYSGSGYEELWLKFVMWYNFAKQWDSENKEWIESVEKK